MEKISNFVEKINQDKDKVGKKKVNVKFHNARKKYSKKVSGVTMSECDTDLKIEAI
jgi:hypothetical protein